MTTNGHDHPVYAAKRCGNVTDETWLVVADIAIEVAGQLNWLTSCQTFDDKCDAEEVARACKRDINDCVNQYLNNAEEHDELLVVGGIHVLASTFRAAHVNVVSAKDYI